jgi:glyoxylase-like metal-dependent hydrolase (beta-lactamase superfamily II)
MHGDHMDGAVHLNRPVLVHDRERAFSRTTGARVMQKLLRQPVPAGVEFTRFSLDGGGDATLRTILAHGREHPTVYLPSHDPESVARLEQKATLQPVGGALEGSIESL